jgi:hypothetical protein
MYKDLNVLRTPTVKDSVYFVFNSTTQKVSQIWVTDRNNIPKQVELSSSVTQPIDFLVDDSLLFYEDSGNTYIASNISQITSSFIWKTGDSTTFTLPITPTNLISIHINGLKLYKPTQFSLILPDKVEIFQTLADEDVVEFNYEHYNQVPI